MIINLSSCFHYVINSACSGLNMSNHSDCSTSKYKISINCYGRLEHYGEKSNFLNNNATWNLLQAFLIKIWEYNFVPIKSISNTFCSIQVSLTWHGISASHVYHAMWWTATWCEGPWSWDAARDCWYDRHCVIVILGKARGMFLVMKFETRRTGFCPHDDPHRPWPGPVQKATGRDQGKCAYKQRADQCFGMYQAIIFHNVGMYQAEFLRRLESLDYKFKACVATWSSCISMVMQVFGGCEHLCASSMCGAVNQP